VFHERSKHIEIKYHYIRGYGVEGSSEAPVRDYRGAGYRRVDQETVRAL
jgi:hypothetical protein